MKPFPVLVRDRNTAQTYAHHMDLYQQPPRRALKRLVRIKKLARGTGDARLQALLSVAPDALLISDARGTITWANHKVERLLGYGVDELIGQSIEALMPLQYRATHTHQRSEFSGNPHARRMLGGLAVKALRKDGSVCDVEVSLSRIKTGKGWFFTSSIRDISERMQTESRLMASETRLRTIIEHEPDCIKIVDAIGRLVAMNPAGLAMIEADCLEQVAGLQLIDLVDPEYQAAFADLHKRVILGESVRLRFKVRGLKGGCRWMDTHAVHMQDQGQPVHLAVTRDVTANQQSEADLRIAAVCFESQNGLVVTDAKNIILRVNQAFTKLTGYNAEEVIGQTPDMFKSNRHDEGFYRVMWQTLWETDKWAGEIWDRRKNGEVYPKWLSISAVRDAKGVVTHYLGAHQDISDRKETEERVATLAFFDQLTGLPNRTLLLDRLKQCLAASGRSGCCSALLFIDLDNFKTLNDTLGHDKGDLLLKQVADRLRGCLREGDTVARLGGDEFVVLLNNLSGSMIEATCGTETAATKILVALSQHYQLGGLAHRSTASIGATLFQGQDASIDGLMKQADLAMYRAKESGRNALRFFSPDMETAILSRVAQEKDVREAVQKKQFFLHYQALVADDGRVTGAEVLARWHHPTRGMVSPTEFIPLAEETGLILPLGHWVLETACIQLANWAKRPEMAQLTIAVNVSAHQFRQPDFVDEVLAVISATGANPQRLKLELTESSLVSDVEDTIAKMHLLKDKGLGFALDDFGTGYSSLSYLKRLPLNQLKIDRSFVHDVLVEPNDAAIAKTIIALARGLGLGVIAEGVETQEQRDFLSHSGCHTYQGYFFSRPLTVEGFEAYACRHHGSIHRT